MQAISLRRAEAPLVLAIDIGTSSVRALLFDAQARQVESTESQNSWDLIATPDDGLVADADSLVELVFQTVDQVLLHSTNRASDIAGVGVSSFWHSMLALDSRQRPHGPLYMWIDNRSKSMAHDIRNDSELASRMRRETGCRPHSSYWPAKQRWLRRQEPDIDRQVKSWVSFSDYLFLQLTGHLSSSICMASGTGFLDIEQCTWHPEIAHEFGVELEQLPQLVDRDQPLAALTESFRERWPDLAAVPWFPPLGDGAAANIGSGCVGPDRIAMTIGTSAAMRVIIPGGLIIEGTSPTLWEYRLDREHCVVGGALSNGGNVMRWLADLMAQGDMETIAANAAEDVEPDAHGLVWLPFFVGERSPSWNDEAFGSLLGMRFSTTREEIFRAALEGTAYRLSAIYDDLKGIAAPHHEIHANGGAALNSPLWMGIIADTFGHRLDAMDADAEVSARGAAIATLNALGIWTSLRPDSIVSSATFQPDPHRHEIYQQARQRQTTYEQAITLAQSNIMSHQH